MVPLSQLIWPALFTSVPLMVRASPVGGDISVAEKLALRRLSLLISESQAVLALLDGTRKRVIAVAIPGSLQIGTMTSATASPAVVAPCPVGSVRPIDLAAVGAQRSAHELPLVGSYGVCVHAFHGSSGGRALLIGKRQERPIGGDGAALGRVTLGTPLAEECSTLIDRYLRRSRHYAMCAGMYRGPQECGREECYRRKNSYSTPRISYLLRNGRHGDLRVVWEPEPRATGRSAFIVCGQSGESNSRRAVTDGQVWNDGSVIPVTDSLTVAVP